jgi:hypothetical protein
VQQNGNFTRRSDAAVISKRLSHILNLSDCGFSEIVQLLNQDIKNAWVLNT